MTRYNPRIKKARNSLGKDAPKWKSTRLKPEYRDTANNNVGSNDSDGSIPQIEGRDGE